MQAKSDNATGFFAGSAGVCSKWHHGEHHGGSAASAACAVSAATAAACGHVGAVRGLEAWMYGGEEM